MKESTKRTLTNLLVSNFKNDSAIDGAKTAPWWIAIILMIVGTFLPIIPLMVNVSKTYGASFIANQSYGFEKYETALALELKEQGYDFKINESNELLRYKNDVYEAMPRAIATEKVPVAQYVVKENDGSERIGLQLFYSERVDTGVTDEKVSTLTKVLNSMNYIVGTTILADSEEGQAYIESEGATLSEGEKSNITYYRPNYILLYKKGLYVYMTKPGTTTKQTSMSGDWLHSEKDVGLLERVLEVEDIPVSFEKDSNGSYTLLRKTAFTTGVKKNFNKVFNEVYLTSKNKTFWSYCGIFYGVYLVLVAFMGLMLFLLSRGKNNPMNYLTYWTTFKMACWSTFAPGVLAMVLGFLLASYATLFFIILYGLRIMWMSMRQLRPAAQ